MSATAERRNALRERRVFTVAAALVAVHTVADAFVAREPGVPLTDHLVAGLVSLGLLGAAAIVFARSRAGMRAVVALVLGALAVEGFALAVADARAAGMHGDHWTGFTLGPAGLALIGLGVVLLWRSRKQGGRWYLRRLLLGVTAGLGIYWVVVPGGGALRATHRPEEAV
ncbi:MAG: hypothetical protein ACXWZ1_06310, partial [Gaiellaceae bacterium]